MADAEVSIERIAERVTRLALPMVASRRGRRDQLQQVRQSQRPIRDGEQRPRGERPAGHQGNLVDWRFDEHRGKRSHDACGEKSGQLIERRGTSFEIGRTEQRAQARLQLTGGQWRHEARYPLQASCFRDVTEGSNGEYSAGPGHDLVTGLGAPNVGALLEALAGD